jgi:chemotaxis response regulator CheB
MPCGADIVGSKSGVHRIQSWVTRGGGKARVAYPRRDILVIGASTGGVDALRRLAEDLPANPPAEVLVVLSHRSK